jgi:hypothetical protein
MKNIFKTFLCGAVMAFGVQVGIDLFQKVKNPVTRVNIKKRFIKIKDAVTGKEES